jgi:tetratricopeptide (TPR) repeat protein
MKPAAACSSRLVPLALLLATGLTSAQTAGVGEVNFPNSGAPPAQASFLAGLAQLHNFEYESAAELFRRAQQLDPGFAMAYWGEAMTYNHPVWMEQDREAAGKVLARLGPSREARLAKAGTAREKDYLRAVESLYGDGEKFARDFAYSEAMAVLHRTYPDDADAAAFYALSLLGTAHEGRDFATYMRAAAILEPVFHDHPNHPGAVHYLIHSYDDPVHAPLGLRAARAYSTIAPSAAHAQHMTSHIFVALGMWDDVVSANETALKIVDRARAEKGQSPIACGHYISWLEYGYLEQGRFQDAKRLVADCYAAAGGAGLTHHDGRAGQAPGPENPAIGAFAGMRSRYLIDSEQWQGDVAGWTMPMGDPVDARVTLEFATGYAAVKAGQIAQAAEALGRLRGTRQALEAQVDKARSDSQPYRVAATILERELGAMIQIAHGAVREGVNELREAALVEEKLPFEFGPPFIDKPPYELLGEALLALDRPADARAAFTTALARTPGRTTVLVGLMQAAAKSGDLKKAAELRADLRAIWHHADQLPASVR